MKASSINSPPRDGYGHQRNGKLKEKVQGFPAAINGNQGTVYAMGSASGPPFAYGWNELIFKKPNVVQPVLPAPSPQNRINGRMGTKAGQTASNDLGPAFNREEMNTQGQTRPVGAVPDGTVVWMEQMYDDQVPPNLVWTFAELEADDVLFTLLDYADGDVPTIGAGMYWATFLDGVSKQTTSADFAGNNNGTDPATWGLHQRTYSGNGSILACHLDELGLQGNRLARAVTTQAGIATSQAFVGKLIGETPDGLAIVFFRGGRGALNGPSFSAGGKHWDFVNGEFNGSIYINPGTGVTVVIPGSTYNVTLQIDAMGHVHSVQTT